MQLDSPPGFVRVPLMTDRFSRSWQWFRYGERDGSREKGVPLGAVDC